MLVNSNHQLPEPDEQALAQSRELEQRIRDEIMASNGSIGFDRFMEMAMYEPGLGYYTSATEKFGAQGDFVTAPEISSLFASCLAGQLAEVLGQIPDGKVLEPGGGSGVLAAQLLEHLERLDALPQEYLLLEVSAHLRERQRQTIESRVPHLLGRVRWLESWPEPGFRGVVIANEVLDAMPVQCFRIQGGEILERRVTNAEKGFDWSVQKADAELSDQVMKLMPELPAGTYDSELNPWLSPWVAGLAEMLDQGVVLLVDYGYTRTEYYHPDRTQGTLICHYLHRVHDAPFFLPGLQDISASVDFTAVADTAVDHGLQVAGYTHQAAFLFGNDLQAIYDSLDHEDVKQRTQLAQEIRQLTLPGEMGERFKVIALTRDYDKPLRGFAWQDLRVHL